MSALLISMFVDPGTRIKVYPAGGPWIVKIGGDLDLHFETREKLTELRDAITAALDAEDPS